MIIIDEEVAKNRIAKRIAKEFQSEDQTLFINTGIGIPTMVPAFVNTDSVVVQAENGILGVGPLAVGDQADNQLINAGRQLITETVGCSYFDSSTSFGMIRGGHIDATIIGAFEVDQFGEGTKAMCKAVAESAAFSIAGGGDTLAALEKYGYADGISYLSTAGGAFLEFLEGKTLPAVAILEERAKG